MPAISNAVSAATGLDSPAEPQRAADRRQRPPSIWARHRRAAVIAAHLLLIPLGYYLSFLLRFDLNIPPHYFIMFVTTLPVVLAARAISFALFRLYNSSWRYSGIADLTALVKANTLASAVILGVLFITMHAHGYPRSVIVMDWAAAILIFGGGRLAFRVAREESLAYTRGQGGGVPVLVIGAGEGGERLMRELRRSRDSGLAPVGVVDDDIHKLNMMMHGVPVLGPVDEMSRIARQTGARRAIVAIPSASKAQLLTIVRECRRAQVQCQIIPSLPSLVDGADKIGQLRNVEIEDLLGRSAVSLDLGAVKRGVQGKTVMVTGGAGSIGSELARQVALLKPAKLILLDQAESPLYFVHLEISRAHPDLDVVPIIADITDRARLSEVFATQKPNHVFHAAAYKHVPMMESNVGEAVRNNVLGSLTVAECAAENGAERFVLISTDKAVRPSSVMGATKRIAERIVLGWPTLVEAKTDFRAVRFGNVLGSEGSVIPLFKMQIARGGPLTVTHPEVTRYFMTIPEASQLVLTAGSLPEAAGRILMLEMGDPVRIRDLAENLIRLSGLEPEIDIQIQYTGLRPGEKLYEELMSDVETTIPTAVEKIRVVQTDEADPRLLQMQVSRLYAAVIEIGRAHV